MRIMWGFIVIALLVMAVGYLSYYSSSNILELEIKDRYLADARNSMDVIDKLMYMNYNNIISVSENTFLQKENISLEELTEFLKIKKDLFDFDSLSYFDVNRIRIADTDGIGIGEQHPMQGFWYEVLNGNISSGSDIRIGPEREVPIIYFAAPVYNENKQIKNVVVARVDYGKINREVTKITNPGVHATLIDKDRNVIFSNCPYYKDRVMKEKIAETPAVIEALKGNEGVILEYPSYHEGEFLTVYVQERGYEEFKGNNWMLGIFIEKSKVFAPVYLLGKRILILTMLFFLFAFSFANLISKKITTPLAKLAKTAEEIGKDNLNIKANVKAGGEVGQLAESFNQMTSELKKSRAELKKYSKNLEKQVKSRTKEIQSKVDELEKFNKLTVGRELRMAELKKRIKELEEKLKNQKIT